ncbi:MAG: transposase [Oscillospiraceae bacterium]|nr:transposase [Oscillospiraceae bacterium]
MNEQYNNINIENYVIMPNHIHLLIFVDNPNGTSRTPSPTNAVIPMFVSTLKRFCNKEIGHNIFQRSFFDHIIRDQADYENVYNYIDSNPSKWESDELYIKD